MFYPLELLPNRCFVRAWYEYRNEPNVLLLHYAEMRTNPRAVLERIAAFLNISVTEEQWPSALQAVSLDTMKAKDHSYLYQLNKHGVKNLLDEHLVRSGSLGEGEQSMSAEMIQQYHQLGEQIIPDAAVRHWGDHGGEIPK